MIIVPQNRMGVVNFDNVSAIYRDRDTRLVCDDINGDLMWQLGEYTTSEECNDALLQCISAIESYLSTNQPTVFYMPQSKGELNED